MQRACAWSFSRGSVDRAARLIEGVVGRIGHAQQGTVRIAGPGGDAARCVYWFDRSDDVELALAAARHHVEPPQRNIVRACGRRAGDDLSGDDAAVDQLPGRADIVSPYGLAGGEQRGDRLAELPDEPLGGVELALVDLGPM